MLKSRFSYVVQPMFHKQPLSTWFLHAAHNLVQPCESRLLQETRIYPSSHCSSPNSFKCWNKVNLQLPQKLPIHYLSIIDWGDGHHLVSHLVKSMGKPLAVALMLPMEAAKSWPRILGQEHHSDPSDRASILAVRQHTASSTIPTFKMCFLSCTSLQGP